MSDEQNAVRLIIASISKFQLTDIKNWTGIVIKHICVIQQEDETNLQAFLIGDLFTEMEPSLRRVRNQKGLDSLSYLDSLHADAMLVRSIELLNLNIDQDATLEERVERNQLVHGANIFRDLEALDYYRNRDPPRLYRMQNGFEVGYGISPSIFDQEIGKVPETVISSLNLKRDLKCLRVWARVRNHYPKVKTAMIESHY